MNLSPAVHNLRYRLARLPAWPCAAAGVAAGVGLAWLFLLRIGGPEGALAYAALLVIAVGAGFMARPVVDIVPRDRAAAGENSARTRHRRRRVRPLLPMVPIAGGTFWMGGHEDDPEAGENEFPRHRVTQRAFEMARVPVTRGVYRTVMGDAPSEWGRWRGRNLPANFISWHEAVRFCNALSEEEDLTPCYRIDERSVQWRRSANGYRLPTEAEWEYAVRTGTESVYFFGDDAAGLGEYAWYRENSGSTVHPVGQRKPNPWGFHDLLGNVMEWCWDWHGTYDTSLDTNPIGWNNGHSRSLRGGSAWGGGKIQRSSKRSQSGPSSRLELIGFRCVRSAGA